MASSDPPYRRPPNPRPASARTLLEEAEHYDDDAQVFGWSGPAVAFGLAFACVTPGQAILDLGIGTGLGSQLFHKAGLSVVGMDISEEMLDVCRRKGFAARFILHDLFRVPYPFPDASFDHAVSMGVFQFFPDLGPVFRETARLIRVGGIFVFVSGDRGEQEEAEVVVGPEDTGTGSPVTMYRHSLPQVTSWLEGAGFRLIDSIDFSVWMDRERTRRFPARTHLARKRWAITGILGEPASDAGTAR